jgi:hypothetical protein
MCETWARPNGLMGWGTETPSNKEHCKRRAVRAYEVTFVVGHTVFKRTYHGLQWIAGYKGRKSYIRVRRLRDLSAVYLQ